MIPFWDKMDDSFIYYQNIFKKNNMKLSFEQIVMSLYLKNYMKIERSSMDIKRLKNKKDVSTWVEIVKKSFLNEISEETIGFGIYKKLGFKEDFILKNYVSDNSYCFKK